MNRKRPKRKLRRPLRSSQPVVTNSSRMGEMGQLRQLASVMVERAAVSQRLGLSYGDDRDLYHALGYNKSPQFNDYWARYSRQDVAKRIIDAPVKASWKRHPEVNENDEIETPFEKTWGAIAKDAHLRLYHYIQRVDKLAGIGRFAILLLGFDDGKELSEPAEGGIKNLIYVRGYSEDSVQITEWEDDENEPRFGLPIYYTLTNTGFADGVSGSPSVRSNRRVHWTRVVHVAEDMLENEVFGTPRLKAVFNRLQDLELVSGSSAEMFWRGAFPGMGFMADADAAFDAQALSELEDEIEEYVHGLKRYIRAQGVTIKQLSAQVADPTGHVDMLLKLISGSTGIPVRILTGSERGELASSQDESNWNSRVTERRDDYCELIILRPLIDRLISVGVLPEPQTGNYSIDWPDLFSPSEKEQVDIAKVRAEILATYTNAQGADTILPPKIFLVKLMGFSEEEAEEALSVSEDMLNEEQRQIEEEQRIREEERQRMQNLIPEEQPQPGEEEGEEAA